MKTKQNTNLINKIKTVTGGRFGLSDETRLFYQNITYYLINNYHASKTKNVDEIDIMIIFDNLFINNEIVDNENIKEYEYILSGREINRIKSGKVLLLNYYTTAGEYRDCRIFLNPTYNVGF